MQELLCEDSFFDLPKIDFIHIWYEVNEGDTTLFYEAREMEYQNYVKVKMKRNNPDNLPNSFWACGLQSHLIDFFRAGDF